MFKIWQQLRQRRPAVQRPGGVRLRRQIPWPPSRWGSARWSRDSFVPRARPAAGCSHMKFGWPTRGSPESPEPTGRLACRLSQLPPIARSARSHVTTWPRLSETRMRVSERLADVASRRALPKIAFGQPCGHPLVRRGTRQAHAASAPQKTRAHEVGSGTAVPFSAMRNQAPTLLFSTAHSRPHRSRRSNSRPRCCPALRTFRSCLATWRSPATRSYCCRRSRPPTY